METAIVRGVRVNVWPTWKRLNEWCVSLVGRGIVEQFTVTAENADEALAAGIELVR